MTINSDIPKCDFSKMPSRSLGGSKTGLAALKIAIGELNSGAGEIGGANRGAWVKKYLNGMAQENSAWCAGFVSYCFKNSGFGMPFKYTLSARELLSQLRKRKWSYDRSNGITPEPGDIVIWWRGKRDSWQGHTGIVHSCRDGYLFTIEGNHTNKVEGFCYKLKGMRKLLGFGHTPDDFTTFL